MFREFLKNNTVYLDGGMGTLLQKEGLKAGELPERWNITHSDTVKRIHKDYFDAGSNVVCTNTFGANLLKFSESELEEIIKSAVMNAMNAREESTNPRPKFIALDIGPTGKLLKPLGDLDFEEAVSIFSHSVKLGVKYGVDLFIIETMNDSYETKAALLAVKENSTLPVIVSNAYNENGELMTGATPEAMSALVEGMGADAVGANCSLGPKELSGVAKRLLKVSSIPVVIKANAGLPRIVDGLSVYDIKSEEFAQEAESLLKEGVRLIGGCCGTTPEYIKKIYEKTKDLSPIPVEDKNLTVVSSYTHAVEFSSVPILIGERINPTGKKRFKEALINNDIPYILEEAIKQSEKRADILDVNVGLVDIDEKEMLLRVVSEVQTVTDLPLQIDTADTVAMEKALRRYNGKAMINSVNGKKESMKKVFPLVKKYGGVLVALTLDENGIPNSARDRVDIAYKIVQEAQKYGIKKKDIIIDPLAMSVSADSKSAALTLDCIEILTEGLGLKTTLGVSNISFGLPLRQSLNSTFFALALERGLSAAIMNPYSEEMLKTYYNFKALKGLDENFEEYISVANAADTEVKKEESFPSDLRFAVIKGMKDKAREITNALIKEKDGLEIVNSEIIPALNKVGEDFENKKLYLPNLLMSAEAAATAFEVIKANISAVSVSNKKATVVIATVKGDIHDIGKNIVKLLLENYGFEVVDLGKDVSPEKILLEAIDKKAEIVALSALMTTTVPAMEETVSLIKEKAPFIKTMVGGAVLTEEYAKKIRADAYAKDALGAVKCAENFLLK